MKIIIFAILKLSLIAILGFFLYRRKLLGEGSLKFLTSFVINFSVPFLIFSQIIENFNPQLKPPFWIFPLLAFATFALGLLLTLSVSVFVKSTLKREFLSLVGFQNSGYLPMNLAFFLLPTLIRDKFLLYIFFYVLGFNILMWSVGSFLLFKRKGEKFRICSLLTPPIISVIISLAVVYLKFVRFIPEFIILPIKTIGKMSFVLSMIILGGWLAKAAFKNISDRLGLLLGVGFLKLIVIPLLVFFLILKLKIYSLFGLFIIIEAAMPSAVSLPIVVKWRGGETEFVSQGVFFTHLLGIFTIPIWIELFLKVSGYTF